MTPSALPTRARFVVIGGGVGGASVAYHLAMAGESDVVVLERADLTSGSTFHSAGLVGALRSDPALTEMNRYSLQLYAELQAGDSPPGWVQTGSLRLASSGDRLQEIQRQAGWAGAAGLDLHIVSAQEAADLFPLMVTDGVHGAAYVPSDGQVDPSGLCYSLMAGARAGGVHVATHTRVVGIDTVDNRVTRVRTDQGDIECEVVVDCGGIYAAEIARMVDVRVPVVPMGHQYVVTEAMFDHRETPLPALRDPDLLVYFRQEVDGLVMGGYERNSRPWTASSTSYDDIPADFNGRLLPEDWERFEEIADNARIRVPAMDTTGIRRFINGPEAFTPDNEFCLGPTDVEGFWVAAGFCAHGIAGAGGIGRGMVEWILTGSPGLDLWHMDVRRFGAAYRSPAYTLARTVENYETYYDIRYPNHERSAGRPLRTSPAYAWHLDNAAEMGEKSGWERVNFYRSNEDPTLDDRRPHGWAGRHWSSAIAAEAIATRTTAALFDESSFAKIEVHGTDALALLDWVFDNSMDRPVGSVTYTQALNDRGGIECDVTVTRTASDTFLVVTGTAFGGHDISWLRSQARVRSADVSINDVSGALACFGLWGPRARDVLAALTPSDLSNDAFPFMTSRSTSVGDIPARITRVTFVGELGWEVYCGAEYGRRLWETVWDGGQPHGLVAAGYRAIDALRLEKSYRVWGADLGPTRTPLEAGLGFCVRWDKPGGFCGLEALAAQRGRDHEVLSALVLDDTRTVALGGEPVRLQGRTIGRITSGGQSHGDSADAGPTSLGYAYLPSEYAVAGTRLEVGVLADWVGATVVGQPVFDPSSSRIRT